MQRPLAVAFVLFVLAALAGGIWLLLRGDTSPPVAPPPITGPAATAEADSAHAQPAHVDAAARSGERVVVAARPQPLLDDPDYAAAMTGWKGRVVDHTEAPVADCGVRLYRGALDSLLTEGLDLFADQSSFVPQYIGGEARTDAEGRFLITGVPPRGFYVLFAGIGTDAPVHQVLSRLPSPGEVVDLGDIVLPNAGVIVGTVLDDEGEPLPGALVRAADLPGSLAAFFPLERFDPKGAILIRERQSPTTVVPMPAWVEAAFEHVPIPTARTDAEGKFRLVGVVPGSNLLAVTREGFLSELKPSIIVRAGQTKDAGRIKLRRGEELAGRVLDSAGKPVAGAELFAGSTITVAPVDLAQRLTPSDAEGRFGGQGFAPGKVTVAARRGPGHPWVLAEPQPILSEVVVTLPATFAVTATITLADGLPAKAPRLRLLAGRAGRGAAEMHMLGFAPAIDLAARQHALADGQWRIDNLQPGDYTLVADAPGHAKSFAGFAIAATDVEVALQLEAPKVFQVRVLDDTDRPVRNAAIYAESRGKRLVEMPVQCGRTDADGRLTIDALAAESLRVSADHPRWGVVHGEAELGKELLLRMAAPGGVRGFLFENGKPPTVGKYTLVLVHQQRQGPRGPLETVPGFLAPAADGAFAVRALQPGTYQLMPVDSLDTLRSPGSVVAMAQNAWLMRDTEDVEFEVQSGQVTEVTVEAGEKPIDGPTATVAGTVTVNGRLASGNQVMAWGGDRRFAARVDERGRFDLGTVPAGKLWIGVQASGDGVFFGGGRSGQLWTANLELKEAEARELTIDITTTTVSGVCLMPDGRAAPNQFVQMRGRLKGSSKEDGEVWRGGSTDANGRFSFEEIAEGSYSFTVDGQGDNPVRGELKDVAVSGSLPIDGLQMQLRAKLIVKGSFDIAAFGNDRPDRCWLRFERKGTQDGDSNERNTRWAGVDRDAQTFATDDLEPGTYQVRAYADYDSDREGGWYECAEIEVPPGGLSDLRLRPGARVP
ncbi:MAG: hypothetical protein JNL08_17130 [Planctomycetes bacterium]|nr:hypothetical protein [Planctomycetota bacterium]